MTNRDLGVGAMAGTLLRAASRFSSSSVYTRGAAAVLTAIGSARKTIRLETYIFSGDPLGQRFRDALIKALQRGVKVQVLVDSFGSMSLPFGFWDPLVAAGGEARWFNPVFLKRLQVPNAVFPLFIRRKRQLGEHFFNSEFHDRLISIFYIFAQEGNYVFGRCAGEKNFGDSVLF